jgi:hypothetical protein
VITAEEYDESAHQGLPVTGPVQVLVVGLGQPTFSGEVMSELDRLRETGTARLLDILMVERAEDGTFETLPAPAGAPAGTGVWRPASSAARNRRLGCRRAGGWLDVVLGRRHPCGHRRRGRAHRAPLGHATTRRDQPGRRHPLEEAWLGREDVERLEWLIGQQGD